MSETTDSNGTNRPITRGKNGRFLPGCPGGPGNPRAVAAVAWREALDAAISQEDFEAIVRKLIAAALDGESWAIREVLDRTLGRPGQSIAVTGVGSKPELSETDAFLNGFESLSYDLKVRIMQELGGPPPDPEPEQPACPCRKASV